LIYINAGRPAARKIEVQTAWPEEDRSRQRVDQGLGKERLIVAALTVSIYGEQDD
jgi:hypothetical protein